VERSPEYRLSEVGRSVVEMAERRRGCKRCLVQETLGICARFHYCLRLAPSTTTDNHLPQQQTNKETTRAFLPSFLRFHTLSFVSATSQKKLQPTVRERDPRHNRRIGGDGKQASPSSQKTFNKSFLSVCAASRHDDDAQSQVLMRSSCLAIIAGFGSHCCVQFRLLRAAASKQASSLPVVSEFLEIGNLHSLPCLDTS
jgi:hypothetical protein